MDVDWPPVLGPVLLEDRPSCAARRVRSRFGRRGWSTGPGVAENVESERPRVEEQLAATHAEITRVEATLERYFEAFEDGSLKPADCQDRIRGHRARLETLREQEADLADSLGAQAHTPPDTAAIAGLADQLEDILTSESPQQAKELLRLLVKEIHVHDRRRIIPTYRIPAAVRAIPRKVELGGLEPPTSWVRSRRSPS